MSVAEDKWFQAGFRKGVGNPVGLLTLPAVGLVEAVSERCACVMGVEQTELLKARVMEHIRTMGWCIEWQWRAWPDVFSFVDDRIRDCLEFYINHLDGTEKLVFWTWETLAEAATAKTGEPVIPPFFPPGETLQPYLSAQWARQRYRMINLLKKPVLSLRAEADIYSGSVHNGIPTSPWQAHQDASLFKEETETPWLSDSVTDIYGPSQGWNEGTYCADVSETRSFRPLVPDGVSPSENFYLNVTPYGTFDDFGTGLRVGLNVLPLTGGQVTWEQPPKRPSRPHPRPVLNVHVTYGWQASIYMPLAPKFQYYHNCDPTS